MRAQEGERSQRLMDRGRRASALLGNLERAAAEYRSAHARLDAAMSAEAEPGDEADLFAQVLRARAALFAVLDDIDVLNAEVYDGR